MLALAVSSRRHCRSLAISSAAGTLLHPGATAGCKANSGLHICALLPRSSASQAIMLFACCPTDAQTCLCAAWQAEQHVPSPNATHLGILMDDAAVSLVVDLVRRLQRETPGPFVRSSGSSGSGGGSPFGRVSAALSAVF